MSSTVERGVDSEKPSFPRQQARTRRFSLGAPRNFTVSPDGERVVFLRSPAGDDPRTSLWVYYVATRTEREVAAVREARGDGDELLPDEERARRERSREVAGGITAYACDETVRHAAFALNGRLWWVALDRDEDGGAVELPAPSGVVDPHPDPTGEAVAFLSGPALYVVPTSGDKAPVAIADERGANEPADVTWGAAEFIAAEEMDRFRGFWWAPDGGTLLAARVDNSPVPTWWTGDPSEPATSPRAHRYPAAGEADALVSLWHLGRPGSDGAASRDGRQQVTWDCGRYPYMVAVHWSRSGAPLLLVEQRDHKACAVLAVDLARGTTQTVAEMGDRAWVDWPMGVPAWLDDGQLLWASAEDGTWRLEVGGTPITPPGLQVREVTSAGRSVVFTASSVPEVVEAWSWSRDGGLRQLTDVGGISRAVGDGDIKVVASRSMAWHGVRARVEVQGGVEGSQTRALGSEAETPVVDPVVRFFKVGRHQLSVGIVLPTGHPGGQLPVIMAPYGGPGTQMVQAARSLWLEAQWFADQGFAVVVADGRGTPGRGPDFEREVYLDLAGPALEDQVEALQGVAREVDDLDLRRVGIKGWSFGGYLAGLAVLARPDVFHAAVAGAPVTDWRWYDTYYTERFLGRPQDNPLAYERCSLLPLASGLRRPLLLVHGLVDDNVFAVHTLSLSRALLAAGRPHSVLPLPGVTHIAARQDVAESLLNLQFDFFRKALSEPA
jgi:dipeptidyl-peptidase 4